MKALALVLCLSVVSACGDGRDRAPIEVKAKPSVEEDLDPAQTDAEKVELAAEYSYNLKATYNGYERYLTPYKFGTKNGRLMLLAYQYEGESDSGLEPDGSSRNWRCFDVSQLENVEVLNEEQHGPDNWPASRGSQSCVDVVKYEPYP